MSGTWKFSGVLVVRYTVPVCPLSVSWPLPTGGNASRDTPLISVRFSSPALAAGLPSGLSTSSVVGARGSSSGASVASGPEGSTVMASVGSTSVGTTGSVSSGIGGSVSAGDSVSSSTGGSVTAGGCVAVGGGGLVGDGVGEGGSVSTANACTGAPAEVGSTAASGLPSDPGASSARIAVHGTSGAISNRMTNAYNIVTGRPWVERTTFIPDHPFGRGRA